MILQDILPQNMDTVNTLDTIIRFTDTTDTILTPIRPTPPSRPTPPCPLYPQAGWRRSPLSQGFGEDGEEWQERFWFTLAVSPGATKHTQNPHI